MKRLFRLALKIIPIITIWQGITSGGARLKPFIDTVKVAITQYEVAQITKLVYEDFGNRKSTMLPQDFSAFIKDTFHSQYSVLAREIKGDKDHDHSLDIWGHPFKLIINQDQTHVKIVSAGPDNKVNSKDDIIADFNIEREIEKVVRPIRLPASVETKEDLTEVHENDVEAREVDPSHEEKNLELKARVPANGELQTENPESATSAFDQDGFDQDGYDRDGYDQNGIHRSEKEIQNPES